LSLQEHKIKEQEQSHSLQQKSEKKEINELRVQLNNYKSKYEEELAQRMKYHKQEQDFERTIR
jgi:hypothetical protein